MYVPTISDRLMGHLYARHRIMVFGSQIFAAGLTQIGIPTDVERYAIAVEEVPIPIRDLDRSLNGIKIAQISDLHMGPHYRPEHLYEAVCLVNELAPDYLLMSGDYVGSHVAYLHGMIEPLQYLQIPTFAILGNHDYKYGVGYALELFDALSITLLRDESVALREGLWLVGLEDMLYARPNFRKAAQNVPADQTVLLLVHEPDYFANVLDEDLPVALQMSGHTHGGQIRLPSYRTDEFGSKLWTPQKVLPRFGRLYPPGLLQVGDKCLYTNRGVGFTGPPIRVNCRPEITLFTLIAD